MMVVTPSCTLLFGLCVVGIVGGSDVVGRSREVVVRDKRRWSWPAEARWGGGGVDERFCTDISFAFLEFPTQGPTTSLAVVHLVWRRRHRFCDRHPDAPRCGRGFVPPPFPILHPLTETTIVERIWTTEPFEGPFVPRSRFGYLAEQNRRAVLENCATGRVNCKGRPNEQLVEQRKALVGCEMETRRKLFGTASYAPEQQGAVEAQSDKILSVKQAMLDAAGLGGHVTPIDDGTFEGDLLLTDQQSDSLISTLRSNASGDHNDSESGPGVEVEEGVTRVRRSSLFLEQMPTERWDVAHPIPFAFDDNMEDFERQVVRQAHKMIEDASCIRFRLREQHFNNTSGIYYAKIPSSAFCGLSYIGQVSPVNPIYLSFMCQDPVGIAAHETMHTLGVQHEHLRSDRDEHLNIRWSNVNPQFYDHFAIADPARFTSYGVPFDFGSIMGYSGFIAAVDLSHPTMVPRVNRSTNQPLMGQRKRLSAGDAALLNAMYCRHDCEDKSVYCGFWALKSLCGSSANSGWLRDNCRKSCKLC